jgi:hypothetical protein
MPLEERREYGLYRLNRANALRRARKKGYVTPESYAKYQFTCEELPFLNTSEGIQTGYNGRCRDRLGKAFSVGLGTAQSLL